MTHPSDEVLRALLGQARTIAIVGLSDKTDRDSNEIARYLQGAGYRIVPVNPRLTEVLGEPAYPSVASIPSTIQVDVVDIFRRPEEVPPIVEESIARGVPTVWMQLGVAHPDAAARGRSAGLTVVEDLCIMTQHRRLAIGRVRAAA
jgi:predicted CoA-binding protein